MNHNFTNKNFVRYPSTHKMYLMPIITSSLILIDCSVKLIAFSISQPIIITRLLTIESTHPHDRKQIPICWPSRPPSFERTLCRLR